MKNYCTECDWSASTANGYSPTELTRQAIEHHLISGHAIGSGNPNTSLKRFDRYRER